LPKQTRHTGTSRFVDYTDAQLYSMTADGKNGETAFRELYARLSGQLYAYCKCLAWRRDEGDDLFQEAFARLYESALQQRQISNISGYLIKIARNLWLNIQRDRRPTVGLELAENAMQEPPHEKTEMLDLIRMAMELLPDDYREAYYMREFADLPYEEIAAVMETTPGNIRIRVTRARERIRGILEPYIAEYQNDTQRQKP
jgi:RNA polymerase sigma-70 factor (ECF subfamily)